MKMVIKGFDGVDGLLGPVDLEPGLGAVRIILDGSVRGKFKLCRDRDRRINRPGGCH